MSKIHGGNIFQFAHEQRIEPYEVIDFSANINPLGPSQRGLSSLELNYVIFHIIQMLPMMMC